MFLKLFYTSESSSGDGLQTFMFNLSSGVHAILMNRTMWIIVVDSQQLCINILVTLFGREKLF